MAISFDQFLKNAGGTVQDVKVAGGDSAAVAQRRADAAAAEKAAAAANSPLKIAADTAIGIPKILASDITETGKNLGEAAAAEDVAKNLSEGDTGVKDTAMRILKQIKTNKDAGKDTARLEEAYNNIAGHSQETDLKDILPTLNKSNFQAVLEAVGAGSNLLLGGSLEAGAAGAKAVAAGAKSAATKVADEAYQAGSDLRQTVQTYAAKHTTVGPQLEESAKRLFLDGTTRIKDPVARYDTYVTSAKKALTDIKADPPLAQVGESVGSAFKQVIAQRRAVGKILGDQLKAVGKVKVNATDATTKLITELKDGGLSYNNRIQALTSLQGTKFAPEEIKMLNNFVHDVIALGDTPPVSAIDNFISKARSQLTFAKGQSGVVGTTNAERIINGTLANLREALDPAKNGNDALAKYWNANKTYSKLSDFLEEGSSYLGKLTQSGDFAKDASLAKSAVQSLLNNGKKDWLIKLEGLTGYKAIDDAVLALQAMKDAGDFRGLSLLQTLADGAVPTGKEGVTQKVIDWGLQKASKAVAGSPEEQTRAFLKSLGEKTITPQPQDIPSPASKAPQESEVRKLLSWIKDNIGDQRGFVRMPGGGDIPKSVTPDKVARNINGGDVKLIQEFVNNPNDLNAWLALQPVLEGMGISNAHPGPVKDLLEEAIIIRNQPTFYESRYKQNGKTGRMEGKK